MTRFSKTLFSLLLLTVWLSSPAAAQTPPIIQVLGVGAVAFDVAAPAADAQAQAYRAYVDARPASALTVTCVAGPSAKEAVCQFPLSVLKLTAAVSTLALTAVSVAVDGELESPRVVAPFVLRLLGPPAIPVVASVRVQPKP